MRFAAAELYRVYRQALLENIVPFWLDRSLDRTCGGYLTCLDKEGQVYDTRKQMWMQSRELWMFSILHNQFEQREEWLEAASLGADFISRFGFDDQGRMHYMVGRDGTPLYRPWNIFTEVFAVIGFAQYALAAQKPEYLERARALFWRIVDLLQNHPEQVASHTYSPQQALKTLAIPMVLLTMAEELLAIEPDERLEQIAKESADVICDSHARDEEQAVFENIGSHGSRVDGPPGRCLLPGHAIEAAWMVMHLGMRRNSLPLIERGADMVEWSLKRGWDPQYGGILYFVDCEGKPPEQLEWDMKLWWVHTEALYGLLLAYHLTRRPALAEWFERVYEWSFSHFPDSEGPEWFGYLHRDGTASLTLKGSHWKGMFHLPRALLLSLQVLERWESNELSDRQQASSEGNHARRSG